MFRLFRGRRPPRRETIFSDFYYYRYPHYHASIIQLGWLSSPKYREILTRKIRRIRQRDYRNYAAITIQYAWFTYLVQKRLYTLHD